MIVLDGRCRKCDGHAPVCATCTLREGKAVCCHCCTGPKPEKGFDCGDR